MTKTMIIRILRFLSHLRLQAEKWSVAFSFAAAA